MFSSSDHPQSAICRGLCMLGFDCACMQNDLGLFVHHNEQQATEYFQFIGIIYSKLLNFISVIHLQ